MKQLTVIPVTVLALMLACPLHAAGPWYAGVQLGPELVTDSDADVDNAAAYGVYGGYRLDRLVSLESSLTTSSHDIEGVGGADLNITSLLLGPRLNGYASGGVNLYVGAGLGIHFLDFDYRGGDDSETETGLYLGAGMEFPLQRGMSLGFDFKYHVLFDDDDFDSDLVTLMFRLGFDL